MDSESAMHNHEEVGSSFSSCPQDDRFHALWVVGVGQPKMQKHRANGRLCRVCGDEIGLRDNGDLSVACLECGFPVCRSCYEFERREGNQTCTQCTTRYKRHKGVFIYSPRRSSQARRRLTKTWQDVEGDDDGGVDMDDFEEEFQIKIPKKSPDNLRFDVNSLGSSNICSVAEARQPLWRKVPIPSSRINPYRIVIVLRLLILVFFFRFSITTRATDAYALWLTSVICEIWFALSWILDQFPKWFPITRETYLDRLSMRFQHHKKAGAMNALVRSIEHYMRKHR
ncbi:hypothetical protein BHM03_00000278 [Ensete ventricosum]|nr:hypothetical protein BHM03_00000278 [Ensete ventricosum]